MKKVVCLSVMILFVFGVVGSSLAADGCSGKGCSSQSQTGSNTAVTGKAVDAGNTVCPVSGEKIKEKTKVTYEYKGKVYSFCCPGCPDEFKKDPEKYIGKIEKNKT